MSRRFGPVFASLWLALTCACASEGPPASPAGSGGRAAGAGASAGAGPSAGGGAGGVGGSTAGDASSGAGGAPATPSDTDASSATSPDGPATATDASPAGGPAPGEYGTRAPLPERNSEFALAALDGKVYILGGYPSSPAETRATLQIYDTKTNTWKLGAPAPGPVHHPMIAGVGGKLYSMGGQPNTNAVFEYDPATDQWRPRMRMRTARGGGAAAVIGTKIYVVGARPPVEPVAINAFEVFDVVADTWEPLPPLPTKFPLRNHLAAGAIGGKIYVAGGRYNECCVTAPRTAALDVFDPATETWTSRADMLRPRGGVAGVVANGCLHVFGGEGGDDIGEPNGVFPDHDVYDPRSDRWIAQRKLPIPFHGVTGGAFVDGLIYMPGGGTRSGGSSGSTMHQIFRPAMSCE